MKIIFSILFFFLSFSVMAQRADDVTNRELKALVGNWTGSVAYTNSDDNKMQATLKAQLEIIDLKDSLAFNFLYTDGDGKQSTAKYFMYIYEKGLKLSFDSALYDIVETRRRGPRVLLYAERAAVDNNRAVDFQEEIIMAPGILNITKGIRFGNMVDFFVRRKSLFVKN